MSVFSEALYERFKEDADCAGESPLASADLTYPPVEDYPIEIYRNDDGLWGWIVSRRENDAIETEIAYDKDYTDARAAKTHACIVREYARARDAFINAMESYGISRERALKLVEHS